MNTTRTITQTSKDEPIKIVKTLNMLIDNETINFWAIKTNANDNTTSIFISPQKKIETNNIEEILNTTETIKQDFQKWYNSLKHKTNIISSDNIILEEMIVLHT